MFMQPGVSSWWRRALRLVLFCTARLADVITIGVRFRSLIVCVELLDYLITCKIGVQFGTFRLPALYLCKVWTMYFLLYNMTGPMAHVIMQSNVFWSSDAECRRNTAADSETDLQGDFLNCPSVQYQNKKMPGSQPELLFHKILPLVLTRDG